MTFHGGTKAMSKHLDNHFLRGKTYYNFWGYYDGRKDWAPRYLKHYGTAFLEESDVRAVNDHLESLKAEAAQKAEQAAHFRI